jgi:hypothetical protein
VAVHYGHFGLFTQRVPLNRIAGAQAVVLDPLAHGGWGYRGGLTLFRKVAIVVRAGAAVRLDLNDGRQLFVTVDDATTAAQLLNALLKREPPAQGAAEITSG